MPSQDDFPAARSRFRMIASSWVGRISASGQAGRGREAGSDRQPAASSPCSAAASTMWRAVAAGRATSSPVSEGMCPKISRQCPKRAFIPPRRVPTVDSCRPICLRPPPRAIAAAARSSLTDLWRPVATGAHRDIRRPGRRQPRKTCLAPSSTRRCPTTSPIPIPPSSASVSIPSSSTSGSASGCSDDEDVHAAARNSDVLSSRDGVSLRGFGPSVVLIADPPDHTRLRHVAAPVFTKRSVNQLTSDIQQLAGVRCCAAQRRGRGSCCRVDDPDADQRHRRDPGCSTGTLADVSCGLGPVRATVRAAVACRGDASTRVQPAGVFPDAHLHGRRNATASG